MRIRHFRNDNECVHDKLICKPIKERTRTILAHLITLTIFAAAFLLCFAIISVFSLYCTTEVLEKCVDTFVKNKCADYTKTSTAYNNGMSTAYDNGKSTTYDKDTFSENSICCIPARFSVQKIAEVTKVFSLVGFVYVAISYFLDGNKSNQGQSRTTYDKSSHYHTKKEKIFA